MKSFSKYVFVVFFFFSISLFPQLKPIKVACIGNSITYGSTASSDQSYPSQLAKLLGSHYEVKNYGISGRTLLRKGDFPYWRESYFVDAQEYEAQIIIIKLGTNDTKSQNWVYHDQFITDYVDFIKAYKKSSVKPQIFICYPCPVFYTNFGIRDSLIKQELPLIDSIRKITNVDLIDFNTPLLDKPNYFSDGVHPTATGYAFMADIANKVIRDSSSGIIRNFYANKTTVDKGEQVTIYWETSGGSSASLNGSNVNATDSLTLSLDQTTSYTLITGGINHHDTASITLKYLQPGKIKSFYAKPRNLEMGVNDSVQIFWTTASGSQVKLNGEPVASEGSMKVRPTVATKYQLNTTGDTSDTKEIEIKILPEEEYNRALDGYVKSTSAAKYFPAQNIVDGDTTTFWKSRNETYPWIYVDMGTDIDFKRVVLRWGKNYAKNYQLQAITADAKLTTIYSNSTGKGGVEDIGGLTGSGKYLRILCLQKAYADTGYMLNEFEVYGSRKATKISDDKSLVNDFQLMQNYPNPFNPSTKISYRLPEKAFVMLKVFDVLGNLVTTLVNEEQTTGIHDAIFEPVRNGNAGGASGVYFYQVTILAEGKSTIQTKKMVLLK